MLGENVEREQIEPLCIASGNANGTATVECGSSSKN